LRWIEQDLLRDGLVYRFPPHLGAAGWEGAFLACSFWMVDNLIMSGQQQKAETLFHRLLALRNDVGLLAAEYHPDHGLMGNFPQALSHLALVKTAYLLQACEQAHHGGQPERHSYRPVDGLQPAGPGGSQLAAGRGGLEQRRGAVGTLVVQQESELRRQAGGRVMALEVGLR